jgi:hypothetical protein
MYTESCRIAGTDIVLIHEFVFKKINEETCGFAPRFIHSGEALSTEEENAVFFKEMKMMAEGLKKYCEKKKRSFFEY